MNARSSAAALAVLLLSSTAAPVLADLRATTPVIVKPPIVAPSPSPTDTDGEKIALLNATFRAKRISIMSKVGPHTTSIVVDLAASLGGGIPLPSASSIDSTVTTQLQSQIPGLTPAQAELLAFAAIQEALQAQLDSMNEMSEMTSMNLQMAMDRRSKFVETLSNVMKKIDSTQETIVQNLK
jgi:hypothetical protein